MVNLIQYLQRLNVYLSMEPHKPSKQAQRLYEALKIRGIDCIPEYSDGHKHVDIAVLKAKLYIEVDGLNHFIDPEQINRDLKRSHFTDGDDFRTFYVTNQILKYYLNQVVEALVIVIESRKSE